MGDQPDPWFNCAGMTQAIRPIYEVPDDLARRQLHGVIGDCLQRLHPPLFVSGGPHGHAFNVRSASGLAIQIRLPSLAPSRVVLATSWEGVAPPEDSDALISALIADIVATLGRGPREFAILSTLDIGTNHIIGLHRLPDNVALAGADTVHGTSFEVTYHRGSKTLNRYTQDFYAVFPASAMSTAEAALQGSRSAGELALFLTLLLRYPIYRKEVVPMTLGQEVGDLISAFPPGSDLREGAQFEVDLLRPHLVDHDSIWMQDQLIYPDPTPYPSDAAALFQHLSVLAPERRRNFFAAVHAYRLGLRLLIRDVLRGFLPELSYSIAMFQTALEALARPNKRDHLLSVIKKRTPEVFGRYRASPLSDSKRVRDPALHEGQLFGGELDADAWAQMAAAVPIRSDQFFREDIAKSETATAAVIVDWLSHGGA